jgi:hypothetical protein
MENFRDRLENRLSFSDTCTGQSADMKSGIVRLERDRGARVWIRDWLELADRDVSNSSRSEFVVVLEADVI